MTAKPGRLDVVDALRGFAIVSIMLVHNLEHFDLSYTVQGLPAWLKSLDASIWTTVFFLFAGKSYAIFSLLFGVTFYLQSHARELRGEDFRVRFAWRMALLFGFGLVNSMFYEGDILTFYAVMGLVLIPVARLSDRAVCVIASILMLQPWEWLVFIDALRQPDITLPNPASWAYFAKNAYLTGDAIGPALAGNLSNGKLAVINWSWETGRMFQMPSLFMLGMLAGRRSLFVASPESKRFWIRTLLIASLSFLPLFFANSELGSWITGEALRRPLSTILSTWSNLAFMLVLVSGFVLLFQGRPPRILLPLGRMSLSSYMMQSVVGSSMYYGYGLALYKVTSPSMCLLIGLCLALLQAWFSAWWLARHKQGPLEALWHRATWFTPRQSALGRP